jgi:hypothetical protein
MLCITNPLEQSVGRGKILVNPRIECLSCLLGRTGKWPKFVDRIYPVRYECLRNWCKTSSQPELYTQSLESSSEHVSQYVLPSNICFVSHFTQAILKKRYKYIYAVFLMLAKSRFSHTSASSIQLSITTVPIHHTTLVVKDLSCVTYRRHNRRPMYTSELRPYLGNPYRVAVAVPAYHRSLKNGAIETDARVISSKYRYVITIELFATHMDVLVIGASGGRGGRKFRQTKKKTCVGLQQEETDGHTNFFPTTSAVIPAGEVA